MIEFYLDNFTADKSFPFFAHFSGQDEPLYIHEHADYVDLILITEGSARHIVDSDSYPISGGDVFVVHEKTPHSFEDTDKLRLYIIMFDPKLLPDSDIAESSGFRELFVPEKADRSFSRRLRLESKDFEIAANLFKQICHEFTEKRVGWKTAVQADFHKLTVMLSRLYDFERDKDEHSKEKIAVAAAYIEQNYAENISAAWLAEKSNYSLRQFIRLFKKAFGCNPTEYIINLRMQKARELLRGKTVPITDIALYCGYGDSNYFSRLFKKHNGMTPSEYRARF